MHAAARCARARLGRRGIALLILGVGLASWGLGYIAAPTTSTRGLELLLLVGPIHCWALLWVAAGAVTFSSAFLRIGRDRWGFVAACVPRFCGRQRTERPLSMASTRGARSSVFGT